MSSLNGSFSKKFRISSKHEIDTLFSKGNSFIAYPFRVKYVIFNERDAGLKILISVPKSKIKTAPSRNRIKRQTRESFRVQKKNLLDILKDKEIGIRIALIYIPNQSTEYMEINKGINKLINKISEIVNIS